MNTILSRWSPLVFLFTLVTCANIQAQNVTVNLLPPAPNQMHISDMWRILLFNNDQVTYKIYLHGTGYLGSDKSGRLIADAQTRILDLPPTKGAPMRITGTIVQPVKINKSDPHYKAIVENTGTVPSGTYYICVDIVNSETGAVMAEDCMVVTIEQLSPVILVFPPDESTLVDSLPSFSWLPPAPLPTAMNVKYNLRVVEVYGTQSPEQAMLSNRSWFERSDIPTTVFNYPFTARSLSGKKRFAWRVAAVNSSDRNVLSESEIWWFTSQDSTVELVKKDSIPNPITGGMIAAGDQFSAGIFETKKEQRGVIGNLKNRIDANGISKGQLSSNKDFSSGVVQNNLNASELNLVASTAGGSSKGALQNNSVFQADKATIDSLKSSLTNIAAKPKVEDMLWMWGRNVEGEVGFMAAGWYSDVPVPYDIHNIKQLACGATHTLMLLKDGTVWAWGDNQFGQLANAVIRESKIAIPVAIPGADKVVALTAGFCTSYALKEDGSLYAWGYNANGELGMWDDSLHEETSPRLVDVDHMKFVRIAARGGHALGIASNGSVYGWGSNYFGEVGCATKHNVINYPIEVLTPSQSKEKVTVNLASMAMTFAYKSISCGEHFSFAVGAKGSEVFSWGRNASGQLLNGNQTDSTAPALLLLDNVDSVSAGGAHTLVLGTDRTLKVGGNNMAGQLGDPALGIRPDAFALTTIGQVIAMASGAGHSMVIKKTGGLWTWGLNNTGQLAVSPIHDIVFSNKTAIPPVRIQSLEQ